MVKTPDGSTLMLVAKDETQIPNAPLTTALSSREYTMAGAFQGKLSGPDRGESRGGAIEVGYQIGCGIDMSTSNGVTLAGTAGLNASQRITDVVTPLPRGILPGAEDRIGRVVARPQRASVDPWERTEFPSCPRSSERIARRPAARPRVVLGAASGLAALTVDIQVTSLRP
jgi:hypothetical protein